MEGNVATPNVSECQLLEENDTAQSASDCQQTTSCAVNNNKPDMTRNCPTSSGAVLAQDTNAASGLLGSNDRHRQDTVRA